MSALHARLSTAPLPLLVALLAAGGFRLYALVRFGPILQPDSQDYVAYAKAILAGDEWLRSVSAESTTMFRTIGYPLVVAAAMMVAGEQFAYALVLIQSASTLVAMVLLFRVGRMLGLSAWFAAAAVTAFGCGVITVFDLNVLTDSLFATLAIACVCLIALPVLDDRPLSKLRLLFAGTMFAACILIRDAALVSLPIFALGVFWWGLRQSKGPASWISASKAVVVFVLPVMVAWQGYVTWNHYRSGYRMMSTGAQYALLMHPLMLEERGTAVLRAPPLRQALAATEPREGGEFFTRIREMGVWLRENVQIDAGQRSKLATTAYLDAWKAAPSAMLWQSVSEYRANQFLLLVNIDFALRELKGLAGLERNEGYRVYFRDLISRPQSNWPALIREAVGLSLSGAIFAAFIFGGAVALWRVCMRRERDPRLIIASWFVILYAGFVAMYMLVHLELRYTIFVQALALIGGCAAICGVLSPVRQRPQS